MTHNLNITRREDISLHSFQKPKAVGFFSVFDENRTYSRKADNLKYLRTEFDNKVQFDLDEGYESYIPKPVTMENETKLDSLLQWLTYENTLAKLLDTDAQEPTFIAWRGLLSAIMKTPYEEKEGWLVCATKVKNLIFLCAFHTDEKKIQIQVGQTDKEKHFEYWGYKFEQYLLADHPTSSPDTKKAVNSNEEFSIIYQSKLKHLNLLYGAEIDGTESTQYINNDPDLILNSKYVELKTSRFIQHRNQERNFKKYKLLRWWCQSYLVGIENIICGFRNDNGLAFELKTYKTKEIPYLANGIWNSAVCLGFLNDFLQFVKSILKNEPDMSIWRFDCAPQSQVSAKKVTDKNEYNILPDWFMAECKRRSETE